jgi:NTP pyrophosphatase (non-canonical NTP hydrolase)
MNINEYQDWTITTAVYPGAGQGGFREINYLTLGLASEAGEVAGKLKKIIRGDQVAPEDFISEVSDVLWYLTRICSNLSITVEQLADYNVAKLTKRLETNTIQGSGDHREDDARKLIAANS